MKVVECHMDPSHKDLYVMRCERANAFKVGVSKDCLRRWGTISTSCPGELTLDFVFKSAEDVEGTVHNILKGRGYHVYGEWFSLEAYDEAIAIISDLVDHIFGPPTFFEEV